jgi:hypothetical protein
MYSEYEPTQETDNANVQVPVKRIWIRYHVFVSYSTIKYHRVI